MRLERHIVCGQRGQKVQRVADGHQAVPAGAEQERGRHGFCDCAADVENVLADQRPELLEGHGVAEHERVWPVLPHSAEACGQVPASGKPHHCELARVHIDRAGVLADPGKRGAAVG